MLNMNSPTVQNIIQSGFSPYANTNYVPTQNNYYGYNPYDQQRQNWNNNYVPNTGNPYQYNNQNNTYNLSMFNGYTNPFMMQNKMENEKIRQREEAMVQGKVWRILLQNCTSEDEDFDIDSAVSSIESLYYYEPIKQELSIKDKITIDKNNHIAEVESKLDYYRQNNIPIPDMHHEERLKFYGYYNHINSIIGDVDNCDMVDYFTRVYPELRHDQLDYEVERFNKNLKNKYNSKDFNKLLDKTTEGIHDSYYAKLMESFGNSRVRLETSNGEIITPDDMEIRLPERLLKGKEAVYAEQRRRFYESVFNKNKEEQLWQNQMY